jgi:nucleotide-binding universal stress UspA family protein
MYKRIVVAIDGSKTSDTALGEAIKLAGDSSATLLLLHVCEEMPVMWQPDAMNVVPIQDILKSISDAGAALLEKHKSQVASQGILVETKLVETVGGRTGSIISEEAQKWAADLLVVGTHGRKGFEHFLMGSVAEGVIRTASMPVLLVRAKS